MNSRELLLFLFLIGMLFFNWPVLEIFRLSLPYYFFGAWALFIAVTGISVSLIRINKTDKDV